jgi:WASH complex subunit 7
LCQEIETDLRWHIHAHLGVTDRNPFKDGVRDVSPWLRLPPLRIFGTTVRLPSLATAHLALLTRLHFV